MDFEKLLRTASKNTLNKKEPVNCLSTKFKPPTKAQREKDRALSDGVQKFLARKEEEDRKKRQEAEKRRIELSALRDSKAKKRIQTMLKRTKSANKSVMEDAIDSNNTADTLAGPLQPDEDDYGFVSETSSALYNKLIQKMYSTPSDDVPKFAPSKKPTSGNLLSTKERVKMALLRQEEEEKGPHRRKRKKKDGGAECEDDEGLDFRPPERPCEESSSKESEKPKPKRPPPPPPIDFMELLKLAEKKQHEPVVVEPKIKKSEPEQLMTKKQREDHKKYVEWKKQRDLRLQARERGEVSPSETIGKPMMKRIPKVGQTSSEQRSDNKTPKVNIDIKGKSEVVKQAKTISDNSRLLPTASTKAKPIEKSSSFKPKSVPYSTAKKVESEADILRRERDEALRVLKEKEEAFKILEEKERLIRERDEALAKLKMLEEREAKSKPKTSDVKPAIKNSAIRPLSSEPQKKPVTGVREFPPKDLKTVNNVKAREFPPKDLKPTNSVKAREFPPKDLKKPVQNKSREFPPKDVKPISSKTGRPLTKEEILRKKLAELKRRRIEDSDEYDSELDDFIDDGPDPSLAREDVSEVISQIFKYDKNKYSRYDDDGGECMESNWAQISKEEYYSTKCGIMEDLEDIKAEREALARKKKKNK